MEKKSVWGSWLQLCTYVQYINATNLNLSNLGQLTTKTISHPPLRLIISFPDEMSPGLEKPTRDDDD